MKPHNWIVPPNQPRLMQRCVDCSFYWKPGDSAPDRDAFKRKELFGDAASPVDIHDCDACRKAILQASN